MNVPEKARGVERGDVIAVINGQPGELGVKQIKCIRDTSIILISSSEKSSSWNL